MALLLLLSASPALRAADPELKTYETKYYIIYTDLPRTEVREAQVRMTRMVEQYQTRTAGFAGPITRRLPFYLYKNRADYAQAGGVENSAGIFDGQRLVALTLRRADGAISLATWHVVQHEAFHQFAHAVIGDDMPMWADEGMAEYFGEGLFTGDGFVTGLIPKDRLTRVQKMFVEARDKPLAELLAISRQQWNAKVEMPNYDQAWSFVHFLMHGEDGRFQKAFADYMREVSRGGDQAKAYDRYLGAIPNLEKRCRDWWMQLPEFPTEEGYARAIVAMLTSFLARAHASGQTFADFDAFVKTPADQIKQNDADWLPPALFNVALGEVARMRRDGQTLVLIESARHAPAIVLTMHDGTRLTGRFELTKEGGVAKVVVDVVSAER